MDIDIALDLSAENIHRFREAMDNLGLRPLVPVPIESLDDRELVGVMVEEKQAILFMLADPRMRLNGEACDPSYLLADAPNRPLSPEAIQSLEAAGDK